MKRIIVLIIIVMAAAAAVFYYQQQQAELAAEVKEFRYKDTEQVDQIRLTDRNGQVSILSKEGGAWVVNGQFQARKAAVKLLLETMRRVRIKHPVPKAGHDVAIANIVENGIKVEIFEGDNKVKSYYMGGPTKDNMGNYAVLEYNGKMGQRPYIIHMANHDGYLSDRYITKPEEWQSRELLAFKVSDIKSVGVHYFEEAERSFELNQLGEDSFLVAQMGKSRPVNSALANFYLQSFKSLSAEAIVNDFEMRDSIMSHGPFARIEVVDNSDELHQITLYRAPLTYRSKYQFDEQGNELQFDVDKFYGMAERRGRSDFALLQYFVFGKVLRSYSDFVGAPAGQK